MTGSTGHPPRRAPGRRRPGGRHEGGASEREGGPSASPGRVRSDGHGLVEHIQALRRYANVLIGNHADADDLVQEALKRALIYLERDREIANLRAYLFTILHNVRKDALKKQTRAGTQVPIEDAPLVSEEASAPDRVACVEVLQAMRQLSEEHRQLLLLVGVEGMSYREAAEILGLPIGTVMSRLNRARAALRDVLDLEGSLQLEPPV